MSMTNDEMLKDAAQRGDIDLLYTVIQNDPHILQKIDSEPYIQTPLHTAAFDGHVQFATEIMRLKPSFAWKLNPEGDSPIHLAMRKVRIADSSINLLDRKVATAMVMRFIHMDAKLVRVKGKRGWTPLHFASEAGQTDLLKIFLNACPDSIEDVTVSGETAMHIAVKGQQFEALQLMIRWLKITLHRGSIGLEVRILNWKDDTGNNILHIAVHQNYSLAIGLLVKRTWIKLNAKNSDNKTALDIAVNDDIKIILSNAGAKCGSSITDTPSFEDKLILRMTAIAERVLLWPLRLQYDLTEEQRNVYMIIAILLATASYQSILSPPGGVYQPSTEEFNVTTSSNATFVEPGTSVIGGDHFISYSVWNTVTFLVSILTILILSPKGPLGMFIVVAVGCFTFDYVWTMTVISPYRIIPYVVLFMCTPVHIFYLTLTLIETLCGWTIKSLSFN